RFRQIGEQGTEAVFDAQGALAELAFLTGDHLASEVFGHDLKAVANTEHRNRKLEQVAVRQRRLPGINAGRTTGKNDAFWIEREQVGDGRVVTKDDGVNVALADPARDH